MEAFKFQKEQKIRNKEYRVNDLNIADLFYILLTVHLRIIVVGNQLDLQFLL
jgi:hypothetical protein